MGDLEQLGCWLEPRLARSGSRQSSAFHGNMGCIQCWMSFQASTDWAISFLGHWRGEIYTYTYTLYEHTQALTGVYTTPRPTRRPTFSRATTILHPDVPPTAKLISVTMLLNDRVL